MLTVYLVACALLWVAGYLLICFVEQDEVSLFDVLGALLTATLSFLLVPVTITFIIIVLMCDYAGKVVLIRKKRR